MDFSWYAYYFWPVRNDRSWYDWRHKCNSADRQWFEGIYTPSVHLLLSNPFVLFLLVHAFWIEILLWFILGQFTVMGWFCFERLEATCFFKVQEGTLFFICFFAWDRREKIWNATLSVDCCLFFCKQSYGGNIGSLLGLNA